MKTITHIKTFSKSWRDLKEQPRVFLPDVIFFIYLFLGGYVLLYFLGVVDITEQLVGLDPETAEQVATQFLQNGMVSIIVSFAIFIVVSFVIGASLAAFKYTLIHDVIAKKKTKMKKYLKICQQPGSHLKN